MLLLGAASARRGEPRQIGTVPGDDTTLRGFYDGPSDAFAGSTGRCAHEGASGSAAL